MNEYLELKEKSTHQFSKATKKHNTISTCQLLAISIFYYLKTDHVLFLLLSTFSVISFLILMKVYQKVSFDKSILGALVAINTDEINYLNHQAIPFGDGNEFIEANPLLLMPRLGYFRQ